MSMARNQRRLQKKQTMKSWKGRSCGECTACCTVLGVTELEKQAYSPCSNACATGCAIYADRPHTCRTYSCGWRLGMLPDEFFPPESGVVVDTTNELGATTVREVFPGASRQPKTKELIDLLAQKTVTIVVRDAQDRTILGPPSQVQDFMKMVRKRMAERGYAPG